MIQLEKNLTKQNKKVTEITMIAPTVQLAQRTMKIIKQRNEDINVFVPASKEDVLHDAVRMAKNLVNEGAMVLISRKGTAAAFRETKLNIPVIAINVLLSDYIEAIEIAEKEKGIIAFFSYDEMAEDVKSICRMLHIDARFYTFKNDSDCKIVVEQAIEEGSVLGIGGVMTQKYADKYKLRHITLENSEATINNAIDTAKQILEIQKEELKKQNELKIQLERYKAVLNFTHDAIIAVDEKGTIDVINSIAENIINVSPGYAVGKNIKQIIRNTDMIQALESREKELNQLMNINGTMVSTNRIPIIVNDDVKGVVATFQDVKVIQENENKIRRSLHEKGLVAKYNFKDIKGESKKLKSAISIAKSYASSDSTVLIRGETGTGKELFAQSIHNLSKRKNGPFVAINCASLSSNLLESELFGYVEGAFTGAVKGGKIGLFELAHKGTIFLDEIGEIPIEIQAQLLRVLQEKEIRKVGSLKKMPVDVRVITATNRDLIDSIKANAFREDLYYRIGVLNLNIPPLRDRDGDILLLSKFFFEKNMGKEQIEFVDAFYQIMDRVKEHKWYGNIRELQNFIERVCVLLKYHGSQYNFNQLIIDVLAIDQRGGGEVYPSKDDNSPKGLVANDLNKWEIEKITDALICNELSIQKAADELGISRTTLWRKMKKYKINV
ncbi:MULTISPECIES: sigma-54-dependent Fis family transcriptional regulator [unclassified Sedimentibacter]|uniref:sigma-54-dependent Fis family transcriptional regulator n=1 Tax=unclassified Sedimentibacter TaxID=2649220 RepID=UPI0027DF2CB3|nr:sigma-54-dependent Fis family transcriptional regulator [Sedimentibacter sp. MB35-C1]WMJ78840.1 sigma 54-interacting transcriptional regulator [Sedimentibacter sp. MB35-C1]